MNEYDSNRILDLAKKINYISTKDMEETDCYILNTCHIREKATDKVYHEVGRVKKNFRNKKKTHSINCRLCGSSRRRDIIKERKVHRRSSWSSVVS